jgi:GT2 family glycosyltransferase
VSVPSPPTTAERERALGRALLARLPASAGAPSGARRPPRDTAGRLRALGRREKGEVAIDVVVCVHDALEDTHRCMRSLLAAPSLPFSLIVVDDRSEPETARYLDALVAANPAIELLRISEGPGGYTRAANRGLRASRGDWVVLLNSDTIVTSGWLEPIVERGAQQESTGLMGPLSNAATHQSVPRVREGGEWAVNELPAWLTHEGMALAVRALDS